MRWVLPCFALVACGGANKPSDTPRPTQSAAIADSDFPATDHAWTKEDLERTTRAMSKHTPRIGEPIFEKMTTPEGLRFFDRSIPYATRAGDGEALFAMMGELEKRTHGGEEFPIAYAVMFRALDEIAIGVEQDLRSGKDVRQRAVTVSHDNENMVAGLITLLDERPKRLSELVDRIVPAFPHILDETSPDLRRMFFGWLEKNASSPPIAKLLAAARPQAHVVLSSGSSTDVPKTPMPEEAILDVDGGLGYSLVRDVANRMCAKGAKTVIVRVGIHRLPVLCKDDRPGVRALLMTRDGIQMSTAQGNVAPGCRSEGPGIAVARLSDGQALGACLAILAERTHERLLRLSAPQGIAAGDVIFLGTVARSVYGIMFSDIALF